MNLKSIRYPASGLAVIFLVSSCSNVAFNEVLYPHNLPHHVAFNEVEFAPSFRPGSGVVHGQLYEKFNNGTKYSAGNTKVVLVPVTSYTTEIFQRKYNNGAYLAKSDPRYAMYVRSTVTDANGDFRFSHLPPGDYYVGSKVGWATTTTFSNDDGSTYEGPETHWWRNYAKVSLKAGQTVTIADWSTGPERITNP